LATVLATDFVCFGFAPMVVSPRCVVAGAILSLAPRGREMAGCVPPALSQAHEIASGVWSAARVVDGAEAVITRDTSWMSRDTR
jgi:hypothetical protein